MTDGTPPKPTDPAATSRRKRPMHRARRAGVWSLSAVLGLALLAGLVVVLLLDQTLRAPQWLRDRAEARIEAGLGGLQLDFGDIELVISEGWRPRAALRDVQIADADGRPILSLSDAQASLAMRPLLRGEIQPKQITLSGAFAVLRRDASGVLSLTFDGSAAAVEGAEGLAPIAQQLDDIFTVPQLAALVAVELTQVNLRYEDAVSGQAWTVDDGSFRLTRESGELRLSATLSLLSGRDFASVIELNYASDIGEPMAAFGLTLTDVPARDLASQSVALSWLEPLRAPLSGALRGALDAGGVAGPLNATLQIGAGVLQPTDQTRPIPFESAQAYLSYDPANQLMQFDEISVVSSWVTGSAEGSAYLGGIDTGQLTELISQMRLNTTSLNPRGLYPEPIVLNGAAADFRLELDPFTLTLGEVFVEDQGNHLHMDGQLRGTEAGWELALDARMDALTPERLVALWPEAAIPKTRGWLVRNLSGGVLSDVNVAARLAPGAKPNIYLDFDYADTQIQFMRTLPPIKAAFGQASLIGNRFVTTATAGYITAEEGGAVDVAGTSFIIPDTSIRRGAPGIVRLQGRGSVTSVLSLLNREPLRVMDRPGLPVDLADGTAVFSGTLALPLKERVEFDEVSFHVDALARDVASDLLVPGQTIEAPTMQISATEQAVEIGGAALLSGIPVRARWLQRLGVPGAGSQVIGNVELSAAALEAFEIGLPPGAVSGTGRGDVVLSLEEGQPPRLTLTSDLVGLRLSLPELGWEKPPAQAGELELTASLAAPAVVDRLSLRAPGLSATGSVRAAPGGGLEVAEFSRVTRADWLDVQARLEGQGPGRAPRIRVLGGMLDLRRADFGRSAPGAAPPAGEDALLAVLDRLQITDTIALRAFQGRFGLAGGLQGRFEGRINGQTPVTGRVVPEDGRSAVRVLSDDAGGVFRDAGLLKQAREGSFDMTLRPVGEPGNFDGSISVVNTFVRDAPAMAALLNAISIVGLLSELAGQGIFFSEVEARFGMSPSRITVYESRATGPSIGLSMDGVYDVPTQRLNMQGVISPVYLLNQIGGLLAPRRGEGLFGFTYTLTGPAQSPQVAVNPLSGLTPGIFREIFRTPPPPAVGSSGEPPAATQEPEAPRWPSGSDR